MPSRLDITRIILKMQYLPNSPITDANVNSVMDTFEDVLADLPVEIIDAAARQYMSTAIFFPTPGKLRETAMDLQILAFGLPTPAEAWGLVITAEKYFEKQLCQGGAELYEKACSGANYKENLLAYDKHMQECSVCDNGGFREDYGNPVVAETVRLLGGRDVILTENPTADRARFIEAYREVVSRERTKAAMPPEVKEYIEERRNRMLDAGSHIKMLSDKWTTKG